MIKVLICDGDGTLAFSQGEAENIIRGLDLLGIQLAVATNNSRNNVNNRFSRSGLTSPNVIVASSDIGVSKPSPRFVDEIMGSMGVKRSEIAFLGDDDKTDILCAINAGILPLSARYSIADKPRNYGVPIFSPNYLIRYLYLYSKQTDPLFGWQFSSPCPDTETIIDFRTLLDQHSAVPDLKETLKGEIGPMDATVGPRDVALSTIIANYLVTRLFLNGDVEPGKATTVAVYPGSQANTQNQLLASFAETGSQYFRSLSEAPPILVRHTNAIPSKLQGQQRDIFEQFRTIIVNPEAKTYVADKHVIVVDDFATTGNSLETARRMLLMAGARKVTGIAVGKFRQEQVVTRIANDWDPYQPCTLSKEDIECLSLTGTRYPKADTSFMEILSFLEGESTSRIGARVFSEFSD